MDSQSMFFYDSPLGQILMVEDGAAITHLYFIVGDVTSSSDLISTAKAAFPDAALKETALLKEADRQMQEYFSGKRKQFSLPLAPAGTAFQQRVWNALKDIPYGQTRSYGQIARTLGNAKAGRAVGMANSKNPISIIIPCHRVIGADGKLVGYGGGLDRKAYLLALEKENAGS
ncbi:MAG: methylated-DNA--[protein]-cysteine S-methyltransferase [Firmicutes bacterium]|nr:methylated-DNA--[protein]-cysteine S-methyltransferase [Bacillota bacterium]